MAPPPRPASWNVGVIGAAVGFGFYDLDLILALSNFLVLAVITPLKEKPARTVRERAPSQTTAGGGRDAAWRQRPALARPSRNVVGGTTPDTCVLVNAKAGTPAGRDRSSRISVKAFARRGRAVEVRIVRRGRSPPGCRGKRRPGRLSGSLSRLAETAR